MRRCSASDSSGSLAAAPPQQVVITDTAGHWAGPWITQVVRAGVMDPFENHTFQPRRVIRRVDLAAAVSRIVTMLAATHPALRTRITERPTIADMPTTHLVYPAAAVAVAARRDAARRRPALRGQSRR